VAKGRGDGTSEERTCQENGSLENQQQGSCQPLFTAGDNGREAVKLVLVMLFERTGQSAGGMMKPGQASG
jgi:hypothetical protein